MNRQLSLLMTSLSVLILPLGLATASTADRKSPPVEREPATDSQAAGTRGCDRSSKGVNLVLLRNPQETQSTISQYPAFFWYLSKIDPNHPPVLRFTLIEPGVSKAVYETKAIVKEAGLWALKLPTNTPGLAVDKEYRWTVALICNELQPSSNKSIWAWIRRVPMDEDLKQKLVNVYSSNKRSQTFLQAGLWHDAYEALIEPPKSGSLTVVPSTVLPQSLKNWLSQKRLVEDR